MNGSLGQGHSLDHSMSLYVPCHRNDKAAWPNFVAKIVESEDDVSSRLALAMEIEPQDH